MKITPIPIPLLSVIATAAIALTACSTPRTIHDTGPSSPSPAACTQAPGEAPCPGGAGVWRPTNAETAVWAAKRFGAERIDAAAARAALESGRPFLVGLPDGGNDRCHSALLVPGDEKPWILNSSSISTAGHALSREQLQYGCDAGMALPGQVPNASQPIYPLDTAARDAAAKAGAPFLYGKPDGTVAVCHTVVVLPSSATWILNREGGAPVEGAALDREGLAYGCDSGVERPTTPKEN